MTRRTKWRIDIVVAFAGLLLLSPVLGVVALTGGARCRSPGLGQDTEQGHFAC